MAWHPNRGCSVIHVSKLQDAVGELRDTKLLLQMANQTISLVGGGHHVRRGAMVRHHPGVLRATKHSSGVVWGVLTMPWGTVSNRSWLELAIHAVLRMPRCLRVVETVGC